MTDIRIPFYGRAAIYEGPHGALPIVSTDPNVILSRLIVAGWCAGLLPRFASGIEKQREMRRPTNRANCHQIAYGLTLDIIETRDMDSEWRWVRGTCEGIGDHSWIEYRGSSLDVFWTAEHGESAVIRPAADRRCADACVIGQGFAVGVALEPEHVDYQQGKHGEQLFALKPRRSCV